MKREAYGSEANEGFGIQNQDSEEVVTMKTKIALAVMGCLLVAAHAEAQCCGSSRKAFSARVPEVVADKEKVGAAAAEPALLCGGCGQIKGSAECCDPKAKKCGACGLAKDSPGCCK